MTLINRNIVTVDDLSNGETLALFSLADEMAATTKEQHGICRGKIMASLFFEPSTRTRLSFEAAMHRLGGSVITASDVGASSLAKGESIADMARVVGSYADIIVIRHPWEGAAKVVADDMAFGQRIGVSGTPGFFVNGHFLSGAQPLAAFEPLIAQAKADS